MKNNKLLVIMSIFVGLIIAAGVVQLMRPRTDADAICKAKLGTQQTHTVMIMDSKVTPDAISAHLCDRLTIENMDSVAREIGFGQHDHHTAYDGISEKVLNKDQSLTITLNKVGEYHFHDHLHDEVEGHFTVRE
jgi:plastocyanin